MCAGKFWVSIWPQEAVSKKPSHKADNITIATELNCSLVCGKFYVKLFAEQSNMRVSLLSCAVALSWF